MRLALYQIIVPWRSNIFIRLSAMFQLQSCLRASCAIEDDIANNEDLQNITTQITPQLEKELKSNFGRCCTYNEQIIAYPCGVILARATFFGSEAVSAGLISIIRLSIYFALELIKC